MNTATALIAAHEVLPKNCRAILIVMTSGGIDLASSVPGPLTAETLKLAAEEILQRQMSPDRN